MSGAASRHDDLTEDQIRSALFSIDPNVERSKWARIGMSLKSELGEAGRNLFEDWSRTGTGFNAKDCADTWRSLKQGGGVNIATLLWEAQQAGWRFDENAPRLNAEQVAQRKAERDARHKEAEAALRRQYGEAAKLANLTWTDATPANDNHPYLRGKRVSAHGLAIGEWPLINDEGAVFKRLPDALLIPIADAKTGKIISLQGIMPERDGSGMGKRYLRNARKSGGFHMIGTPSTSGDPLLFCEGYATGATIHALTGWCVIVCFDAPNVPTVAEAMRPQFPQAPFLFAADNDAWTTKQTGEPVNPGVDAANRAAQATRGFVIVPQFADDSTRPTDFNDLAQLEGGDVALAQLLDNPITRPKPQPAGDVVVAGDRAEVDYFTPLRHLSRRGPLDTIENMEEVLDRLEATARYNQISKDVEVLLPGEAFTMDTQRGSILARLKSECTRFGMPTGSLQDYVLYIAGQNVFNPVHTWITSTPWDGRSRFGDLLDTVKTRADFDKELWPLLLRRWLISAVAAAVKPSGFWSKGVLVFQGAQSEGKTSWFRTLVPEDHRELIKVDATIDPTNKDTVIGAVSHWLVELGELDGTLRRADIARLKGFISQDRDSFRRPYARAEEHFQRRTVFFASVNPDEFLGDDTGNVRWWTIPVVGLNLQHGIDMQQLWAEVLTWYEAGEQWWLTREEEQRLEAANSNHAKASPVVEMILARFGDVAPGIRKVHRTATQVLLSLKFDKPTRDQQTDAATTLRKLFGEPKKTKAGRFYEVPDVFTLGADDAPF